MSEPLAEARVIIVPDLSRFSAELKTQLAAQIKAVEGATVAVQAKATADRTATKAEEQLAGATATVNSQLRVQKKQALEAAAAHEALGRGAGSAGLSLLGIRGATLAAGSEFLIGAAALTVLSKSVQGAIDDQETLFRVTKVLGTELGEKSRVWSQTLANSFGIADDSALKFEGAIAETLHNVGILPQANARLSQTFVELAADMAAFAHVPVEDTLKALQLAISGNARSLRQYGVVIQNSEVQQRALAQTGKESTADLGRQELAYARISIILDRTKNQVGAFADNQDSLANKSKILSANLDALGDSVGGLIIGPLGKLASLVTKDAQAFNDLISALGRFPTEVGDTGHGFNLISFGAELFKKQLELTASPLASYVRGLQALNGLLPKTSSSMIVTASSSNTLVAGLLGARVSTEQLLGPFNAVIAKLGELGSAAVNTANLLSTLSSIANSVVASLSNQLANVQEAVLRVQITGGTPQQILQAQQAAIAVAQGKVAAAIVAVVGTEGRKGHDTAVNARRDAEKELKDAQDAAKSTQAGIDAAAKASERAGKSAASAAKKAAKDAQQILDAEDQALQFNQQLAQGRSDLRKLKAQRTKSLADDVAASQAELGLIQRQIVEAQKIHDTQQRLSTIQQLILRAEQTQQDIQNAQDEIAARRRQRIVARADARVQLADLDAQIADARGNKAAEIRALLKLNAALELERRAWIGNTIKQKQITLEIARNNEQIKELRKEKKKNNDLGASAFFEFLQTQQGFASTLLGNLFSASAIAGTVGGGAISTPTSASMPGPAAFATAVHQRPGIGGDVSSSAQISAGARGASAGQMSTLISIQRAQLAILRGGQQRTAHPEAAHAWAYSATEMLNTGW